MLLLSFLLPWTQRRGNSRSLNGGSIKRSSLFGVIGTALINALMMAEQQLAIRASNSHFDVTVKEK